MLGWPLHVVSYRERKKKSSVLTKSDVSGTCFGINRSFISTEVFFCYFGLSLITMKVFSCRCHSSSHVHFMQKVA
jgi:hypothetical protein